MKTNFGFNKLVLVLVLFVGSLSLISCNETLVGDENLLTEETSFSLSNEILVTNETASPYCGEATYTLWAGQTNDWGTITVANDAANLYVTYTSTNVTFGTLHLWVGTDLTLLPMANSAPINGHFPYVVDATGLSTYTFTIPLNSISFYTTCGNVINVVAHAEMGEETAYGGNIPVNVGVRGRWYYYAAYTTACCETPPPPSSEKLGTAFAKGGYVFTTDKKSNPEKLPSLNLTKNRWGWAINITTVGTYTYELWVGAGLNNTSKGLLVGNVVVDYNGSQATVTYNLNSGYSIEEAHVYAGDFKPTTIAPGQYGNTDYFNPFATTHSVTVDVTDTNGDGVWVIAHAVAYGTGIVNV